MKDIFLAIQTALAATFRWIDFDMGQLDAQPLPPISFPCALISFGQSEYEYLLADTKIGEAGIEIALAFQVRERTHSKAESTYKNEALEHIDAVEAAILAVEAIDGTAFKNVRHTRTSQDRRADLRVWRIAFTGTHYPMPPDPVFVPWADAGGTPPGPALCIEADIAP